MTRSIYSGPACQGQAIIRPREAAAYLGIAKSTLYRMIERGDIPRPIKLSAQVTGWRLSVLDQFITQRQASGNETQKPERGA